MIEVTRTFLLLLWKKTSRYMEWVFLAVRSLNNYTVTLELVDPNTKSCVVSKAGTFSRSGCNITIGVAIIHLAIMDLRFCLTLQLT